MLRCRGWRIYTSDREAAINHKAVVCDEDDRVLAGPFRDVFDAVLWVHAHSPPRIVPPRRPPVED